MRKLIVIVAVLLVAVGGWYFFRGRKSETAEFQTAPVTRGDLTQAVTATGTLNPVVNVQVGSQISGNIQKLFADFNTEVKANQVVAQLDPATFEAAVHQAEGDLANAKAALELARLTAKRKAELAAQKAVPQADFDAAQAALLQAEANIKIKQANVERAKVDLDRCTIYSPIDGIVISRSVDVGQTVAASMTAPVIFTIANDLRNMQIDTNVAEADIGNIEVNQDVDFTVDAFPFRTFHGSVKQVRNAPITVQNVVTYDTVISVNNDELKLKPGMTANVSVVVSRRENVLTLLNAALRFRPPEAQTQKPGTPIPSRSPGGGRKRPPGTPATRTVYVLKGNQPEPREVKLGVSDGIRTEVLDGLSENEPVIISSLAPSAAAPSGAANPLGGGGRRPF